MHDLHLYQATPRLFAVAYGKSPKLLHAFRIQRKGELLSVSTPLTGKEAWQHIASGPSVHEVLVALGIYEQMVDLLGAEMARQRCKPRLPPYRQPAP